jgi:hypothetical protein
VGPRISLRVRQKVLGRAGGPPLTRRRFQPGLRLAVVDLAVRSPAGDLLVGLAQQVLRPVRCAPVRDGSPQTRLGLVLGPIMELILATVGWWKGRRHRGPPSVVVLGRHTPPEKQFPGLVRHRVVIDQPLPGRRP